MKKFNQFLESKIPNANIEEIASLIVESDFDYSKFAEWYVSEGQYLSEQGMWQGIKNFAAGAANRVGQGLATMGQNYAPGQGTALGVQDFAQGFKKGGQDHAANMKIQKAQMAMKNLQDLSKDLINSKLLDQASSGKFMQSVQQINNTIQNAYMQPQQQAQQQPQQQPQQQQTPQAQQKTPNSWQQGLNNMKQTSPTAPTPQQAMGSPYG